MPNTNIAFALPRSGSLRTLILARHRHALFAGEALSRHFPEVDVKGCESLLGRWLAWIWRVVVLWSISVIGASACPRAEPLLPSLISASEVVITAKLFEVGHATEATQVIGRSEIGPANLLTFQTIKTYKGTHREQWRLVLRKLPNGIRPNLSEKSIFVVGVNQPGNLFAGTGPIYPIVQDENGDPVSEVFVHMCGFKNIPTIDLLRSAVSVKLPKDVRMVVSKILEDNQ
ncbi:MAG: hypothetical protein AAF557_24780 [Pseudomonadota bacterium]